MQSTGIKGKLYEIIKYIQIPLLIKSNFNLSESFTTNLGVKQGEPKNSVLFNIYIFKYKYFR